MTSVLSAVRITKRSALVGMSQRLDHYPAQLSGGDRRPLWNTM
jgi:predicted ABC-type transport system involved in lysophospholipase L1 biosynthesis ATPase subunit